MVSIYRPQCPPAWFWPRTPPPNGVSFLEISNRLPFLSAGAKAFVCDQCGAQFSKEDALETHRQTHTGELTLLPLLQVPRRVTAHGFAVSSRQHPFISDTHSFPGGAVSGASWAGVTLPQKDSCPVRPRSVSNRPRSACLHRALQDSRGLRKSVTVQAPLPSEGPGERAPHTTNSKTPARPRWAGCLCKGRVVVQKTAVSAHGVFEQY